MERAALFEVEEPWFGSKDCADINGGGALVDLMTLPLLWVTDALVLFMGNVNNICVQIKNNQKDGNVILIDDVHNFTALLNNVDNCVIIRI